MKRLLKRAAHSSAQRSHALLLAGTLFLIAAVALLRSRLDNTITELPKVTSIRDAIQGFSTQQQQDSSALYLPLVQGVGMDMETALDANNALAKRDALLCSETSPCPDGSCCSNNGVCGYGPTYCASANCTSNCDALAMCGVYSDLGGTIKCGMNTCCSLYGWCGVDNAHCGSDERGNSNCQTGFGSCDIVDPPTCGSGSGTTNARSIAYYQASNVRERACNKISPSQIATDGLTHLYFAFARFDPKSFAVVPNDPADVQLYTEFTALKSSTLSTWIAIGGFDFSDPGTSTFTAWSNMTGSQSNRAAFISSLKDFMDQYGFQGVDLDWEYPGTPERGGQRVDSKNFVALVQEMRQAFGSAYGISLTLAPDYWYLRWFNAKEMEGSVDWFGFMSYDLHGSWDSDVKTLDPIVRGQADIMEISNDTLPLWFEGLDPSKINFGLAYYGRGYRLSSPSCNTLGCSFSGASNPGRCTNFKGVLSLREIEQMISKQHLSPTLLPNAMMKQITWDDQWIGYDDAETHKLKKAWADEHCFGGVMYWSIDFASGAGSGDQPVNTTDGTCGLSHGGTVCGDWPEGNCCSSSGYCGFDTAHCGSGCQSGECLVGWQTTDGTCGAGNSDAYCGDWAQGSCCSAAGYCGNSTAHCGEGCQSGCPTRDGLCGAQNHHNTCQGYSGGSCCGSSGLCGVGNEFCGPGCQNGDCAARPANVTTDGTCSLLHGIICGGWPLGSCCSSFGICGSSDTDCGDGCQSGPCLQGDTPIATLTASVTSTMTTLPPGLSIEDFTYAITTNIWLTTTDSSASTTIVPVILPCITCQPEIVWNLPEIPNVVFD